MSIEQAFYCDGPENRDIPGDEPQPDGCPHNVRAMLLEPTYLPGGVIEVRRHVQGALYETLHFCGWDCLLRYAGQQRPTEYITLDGEADRG
jgi:hypothetical protein